MREYPRKVVEVVSEWMVCKGKMSRFDLGLGLWPTRPASAALAILAPLH